MSHTSRKSAMASRTGEADDVASSVGNAYETSAVYSPDHPIYRAFSDAVTQKITQIAERETVRRSTARPYLLTVALGVEEIALIQKLYPEFNITQVPLHAPGHAVWVAQRRLANEWLATTSETYSSSVIHHAGSLLAAVCRGASRTHIECNPSNAEAVHDRHQGALELYQVYREYAKVQMMTGAHLRRDVYDAYLRGEGPRLCYDTDTCVHQADAMCVDLSVDIMSPMQVAAAMLQHRSIIAHGCYIYHPSMMVKSSGELPGTGVWFEREHAGIRYKYPEGTQGVQFVPSAIMAAWLASHTFSIGAKVKTWFSLELMKVRGSLMFFRMVKLDQAPKSQTVRHALEMPDTSEYYLVRHWQLKSLAHDPEVKASWRPHQFLARRRTVDRVYEFAMQLKPELFTRYAIKNQVMAVNNRFVVAGSTVVVNPPLEPAEVEALATAIFARAFVDRYDSARLSTVMMNQLKMVAGFSSFSYSQRLMSISASVLGGIYQQTLGGPVAWLKRMCDMTREYLKGTIGPMSVQFETVPSYVVMDTTVKTWRQWFSKYGESYYSLSNHTSCPVVPGYCTSIATVIYGIATAGDSGDYANAVRVVTELDVAKLADSATEEGDEMLDAVRALNVVEAPSTTHIAIESQTVVRDARVVQLFQVTDVADPVAALNDAYPFPSVASQDLQYDSFSLSLDSQDRVLSAPYLRMATYFGLPPAPRAYYRSKVQALNVPKRQQTAQELLSAVTARNLSAPAIALPQEQDTIIKEIFDNFLDTMCLPDARAKLAEYQQDGVLLGEDALRDWIAKAKPGAASAVTRELQEGFKALSQMSVSEYIAMIKSDVKPTLSVKPVEAITAPQVIVYHNKALSALFSAVFRLLVRRFLSLLRPTVHVNLLKDTRDISSMLSACHPYGKNCKYLENDFSKYDKSQSEFVFLLEAYVFRQLGLNQELLDQWAGGHVDCNIRSVSFVFSVDVSYQRKSGDATTAFGNVILNILSVSYAYIGTKVIWALFMGDDSLVCTDHVVMRSDPIQVLAEVFNLSAKYYITDAPYYASNFVVIDDENMEVALMPDPVKRIERLSMHVNAEDPCWHERYISFRDAMQAYLNMAYVSRLPALIIQRYDVDVSAAETGIAALSTLASHSSKFRTTWETEPTLLLG